MTQVPPASFNPGMKPHRGTMILILGITGFFCIITAILAIVFGKADLKEMKAGTMDPSGESLTKIGYILGIVFTILGVLGILFYVLMFILAAGAAAAGAAGSHP